MKVHVQHPLLLDTATFPRFAGDEHELTM